MDGGRRIEDREPVVRFNAAYAKIDIKYDYRKPNIITIEGVDYDVCVFTSLGIMGMKAGELFKIDERKDDTIVLTHINENSVLEQARALFTKETFDAAVRVELEKLRRLTAWQRFKLRWFSTTPRKTS